jgi:hypothetical protein
MFYVVHIYEIFVLSNIPYLHVVFLNICTYPGVGVAEYSSGLQVDGQVMICAMGKIFCFSSQHLYWLLNPRLLSSG